MDNEAIRVSGLNKYFPGSVGQGQKQVLFDVGFKVRSGVTTGYIGVNGSGKTTSLKCILGFLKAPGAEIEILDEKPPFEKAKLNLGYLPERPFLYEFLTAKEFLKFHWDLSGGGSGFESACQEVLERVNLPLVGPKRIRQFSKGMMQRIGFAQALLRNPKLLILDEPMSGLDPDGRFLIKEILKTEKRRGTTIFFSSHFLGDVEELCDDLIVIEQGQILYAGETRSLVAKFNPSYRLSYLDQAKKTSEASVELTALTAKMNELEKSGSELIHVSGEFVALEVAFQALRGSKDSGS